MSSFSSVPPGADRENAPVTQPKKVPKPRVSASSAASSSAKVSLDQGFESASRAIVQASNFLLAQGRPLLLSELPASLIAPPAAGLTPGTLPLPRHSLLAALMSANLAATATARTIALPTDAGVWLSATRFTARDAPQGAGALPLLWRPHKARKGGGGAAGSGQGAQGQGQDALEALALPVIPVAAAAVLGITHPSGSDTSGDAGAGAGGGAEGEVWCVPLSAAPPCCAGPEAAFFAQLQEAELDSAPPDLVAGGAAAAAAGAAAAKSLVGAGLPLLPFTTGAIASAVAEAAAAEADAAGDAVGRARADALAEAVVALRLAQAEAREVARERASYEEHMKRLHEYNDVRDVAQALLGALAQNRGGGVTVKDLYAEFGLDADD